VAIAHNPPAAKNNNQIDFLELDRSRGEGESCGLKRAVLTYQMIMTAKRLGDFRKVDLSFYKQSDGFTIADIIDLSLQRISAVVADRRFSIAAALGISVLVFFVLKML
jgi:hypothetical protein